MIDLTTAAKMAIQLMDLTSLNLQDTPEDIRKLCESAKTPYGSPAALCVYPEHVVWARYQCQQLGLKTVKIATVTNFPGGYDAAERAADETERAVFAGADEVDVVFPYQQYLAGNEKLARELIQSCKARCGQRATLKVILETGVLQQPSVIRSASLLAIEAGADFIKTSTGKVAVNATLEAAREMLTAIADTGGHCGFKAAGGVRTAADAQSYLQLAEDIVGRDFLAPATFRFGASGLLVNLQSMLDGTTSSNQSGTSY
ncbi:deoxyribose-phosphate aldolase [Pseudidiomarina sp. 1ASP75-14]|uniref:deoxyribose-phosphate aldolase n=1 Tax=Pseudidiomarina terrestris TaxID=2820060 RepID=UPI0026520EC8|nr:deoxyribose-phosphate aldolase [Pseudidiomarina sp. 1ASP75-14]MDN7138896.1 deoxyribose-phosphate aldolase [Pseudidiomarina sp. 1ASP75-14]